MRLCAHCFELVITQKGQSQSLPMFLLYKWNKQQVIPLLLSLIPLVGSVAVKERGNIYIEIDKCMHRCGNQCKYSATIFFFIHIYLKFILVFITCAGMF